MINLVLILNVCVGLIEVFSFIFIYYICMVLYNIYLVFKIFDFLGIFFENDFIILSILFV